MKIPRDPSLVIDKNTRRLSESEIAEFHASVAESIAAKVKQNGDCSASKMVRNMQALGGEFESYAQAFESGRAVAREEAITILSHSLERLRRLP